MAIGEDGLGDFARWQLEAIQADPREKRGQGAMLDDYVYAMEEAERIRTLGTWGLVELQQSLAREEVRLGASRNDETLTAEAISTLQAAWERSEFARRELDRGHPHLNEQALISMLSALDAMVEQLCDARRSFQVKLVADDIVSRAEASTADKGATLLTKEQRDVLVGVVENEIEELIPQRKPLEKSGVARYERVLRRVGLGAADDRLIPDDLNEAMVEVGVLRNVLVHAAGRLREKDLQRAPTLRYQVGELIRVSRQDYRRYSAALRCYGDEIRYRSLNGVSNSADSGAPNLKGWAGYYRVNA